MDGKIPAHSGEIVNVYDLLALLAGEEYSRETAIEHIKILMEVSRSPYISTDLKRAIWFVQSFTFSLSNLNPKQMAELVDVIDKQRKALTEGF
ncbi:hypothetical protein [Trichormus variabilis]|uniref:Uncharacterized protein n=1 Tax=Trichormus variabilis SAG 1403-4b TaxID=447716 RepID=A0A433UFA4_ANAVA|nr:hypothetical protein [Trichormus variabilis]MBD2629884.1 hypothetical protein [Trichormus variabilis FACHB-164]RUS92540.1 hypothetical protein DSM107003_50230 [Trichormus variabilis SAG 1403-4b]